MRGSQPLRPFLLQSFKLFFVSRVIHKVRQTQHQNPEFGHTQGETEKKPAKKHISIGGRGRGRNSEDHGGELSFILSFLPPERLQCCYIYLHCSYLYNYYN
jgi:hypothetical protein